MKIRIKNFRSLMDTGDINLKPITVLVGKNSSGKSSFIRTFPLLKQSAEERTRSPILLYGRYVDFGSYSDIKPKVPVEKVGAYELIFTLDTKEIQSSRNQRRKYYREITCEKCEFQYGVEFQEDKKQSLFLSTVNIQLFDNNFTIAVNPERKRVIQFKINDENIFTEDDGLRYTDSGGFYFDIFTTSRIRREGQGVHIRKHQIDTLLRNKILKILRGYVSANTLDSSAWEIVSRVTIDTDENILHQLKGSSNLSTWKRRIRYWTVSTPAFVNLKNLLVSYYVQRHLTPNVDVFLKLLSSNSKYLAPLRATAERYYRIQHLAVDEVDPNGKNLPIFLDSLTEAQLSKFNSWTEDNFNFGVKIQKIEGHYSIIILQGEETETNLSDMGFGYSQILPILTQIWHSTTSSVKSSRFLYPTRTSPLIIAIEQPELHLHPEFQAKFSDAIVKLVKYSQLNGRNVSLVIETHSDVIINRLGECVQEKEIKASDIEMVIFNKEQQSLTSEVSTSCFDDGGRLMKWPFGFFQPSLKS